MARTAPVPNIPAIPGMCPGVAVMGGGGGSGGKGGKGAGSGGGENGAGGEGGAGDAEGDGRGSPSCGQGSPGGCNNCGNQISTGDPVDVASGKAFTLPKRDVFLPGTFNFEFKRSYCTASRDTDVGMGNGWRHTLGWHLVERKESLKIHTGDGRIIELPRPRRDMETLFAGTWTVMRGKGIYVIYPSSEFAHVFKRSDVDERHYVLSWVRYRNRGHLKLDYNGLQLTQVTDTVGRRILFHNNPAGRIDHISVPAENGHHIVYARYWYDKAGNLIAATDADGSTMRYAYDEHRRMTQLTYPNGMVFHFVYDGDHRCVETWGGYPDRPDPALAPNLPDTLTDGRTKVKGIYHCRLSVDEEFTEVHDTVGFRRFVAGPEDNIAMAVNARGGVTTRAFDEHGRVIAQTDANGATTEWELDRTGNIVSETDALGNQVRIVRNDFGQELEVVDAAGGSVLLDRDESGEIVSIVDQKGVMRTITRDARGMIVEQTDARGGKHVYQLDQHANRVAHTFPNGETYRFEYDYWGRMVCEKHPSGKDRRYTYTNKGRTASITDRLGRSWARRYDAMGNLASETAPDGTITCWEYGGLNWLYRVQREDGSELRGQYNHEGWLMAIVNERGEAHRFEYDAAGAIVAEHEPMGRSTSFGHDLLGRVVWANDGRGKRLIERNAVGQVVSETAHDDTVRSFAYNSRGELVRASTSEGTGFVWERSPVGDITREDLIVDNEVYSVQSVRNEAGDRTLMKTSLGYQLHAEHDWSGRVTSLDADGRPAMLIRRDRLGLPVRRELPGGGAIVDAFDEESHLRRRSVEQAGGGYAQSNEPEWIGRGRPGSVDRRYDYSPVGELLRVTSSDRDDIELSYDVRRHLTAWREGETVESFVTDPAGNLHEQGPDVPARHYGPGNQLLTRGDVSYIYDEQGYLVEKRTSGKKEQATRYQYNGWGMLSAVEKPDGTRVEFRYGPFARRFAKKSTIKGKVIDNRHFVWDLISMVHEAPAGSDDGKQALATYLYMDNDEVSPIAQRDSGDDAWVYYVADVTGTPESLINAAGQPVGTIERKAFGRMTPSADSEVSTSIRFPGQYDDVETGLHYNRYRYYDPDAGRYISPDPIGISGGFNLYAYARNPVGWIDSMGWQHLLAVTHDSDIFQPSSHRSVVGDTTNYAAGPGADGDAGNIPPALNAQQPLRHSEQKFSHDLISQHRANGGSPGNGPFSDNTFNLSGSLPPCPACHASMRRAAAETGATINYEWGGSTITYSGSSPPAGNTQRARRLTGTYNRDMNSDGSWTDGSSQVGNFGRLGSPNPGGHGTSNAWGYSMTHASWDAYRADRDR